MHAELAHCRSGLPGSLNLQQSPAVSAVPGASAPGYAASAVHAVTAAHAVPAARAVPVVHDGLAVHLACSDLHSDFPIQPGQLVRQPRHVLLPVCHAASADGQPTGLAQLALPDPLSLCHASVSHLLRLAW